MLLLRKSPNAVHQGLFLLRVSVTSVLEFEGAEYFYQVCLVVKSGFSEKATKFEKNLCRTFDYSDQNTKRQKYGMNETLVVVMSNQTGR